MRLLLAIHYTGPFDDDSDLTHVVVELDPRYQLDMRAVLRDVLAMPHIYSVTFFDYTPQPVVCEFNEVVPDWFDEEAEVLELPEGISLPAADFRIEAPTIRYMPDGIMWHFYEKHGGAPYETTRIEWSMLEAAAKQQGSKHGKNKVSHADRKRDRS